MKADFSNDFRILVENLKHRSIPEYMLTLAEDKKSYICVGCGNGNHGGKGHGAKLNKEETRLLCGVCGKGYSYIDVAAAYYGVDLSNFVEGVKEICKIEGVEMQNNSSADETVKTEKNKQPAEKFTRLTEAQNNLPAFIESQGGFWRGLTLETLKRLNCGFLPDIYFPDAQKKLPAVIIPNDLNNVFCRAVDGGYYRNFSKTSTTTIYLPDSNQFDLIVVEGAINGASIFRAIWEVEGKLPKFGILASGGTSGNKNVFAKIQELKNSGKNIRVLIAYDNDSNSAGQNAAEKLYKMLKKNNVYPLTIDITKTADLDLNDVLQQEGGEFLLFEMVNKAIMETYPQDTEEENNLVEIPHGEDAPPVKNPLEELKEDIFSDNETDKFFTPYNYYITNHGIKTINKKGEIITACDRAVLVKEKFYNLEDRTYKMTLEYLDAARRWHKIPAQARGYIFNRNKIVDLASNGLPVTSNNAKELVNWLYKLDLDNEKFIPLTYTVNRCGWYNYDGKDYFIDPRINNQVADEGGKKTNIIVDSDNLMAKDLTTAGTLEKWKEAYFLAKDSSVAMFNIAAAVAPALLKVLGERNFVCYTYGKTRSGKSTALNLAASAVGNLGLVRAFDATNNGLTAAAMNTNHYPFFVDEKQSADPKLKSNFQAWVYNDANGTERTRADKNGNPRPVKTWQHITICNGETVLLDDSSTGGAHTRILQIAAPDEILDPDTCKKIRDIIKDNYGHAYPLFVNQLMKEDINKLREDFNIYCEGFSKYFTDEQGNIEILPDYIRYVALVFLANSILNDALNIPAGDNSFLFSWTDILRSLPTAADTDDATREFNSILGFITEKAAHFVGSDFYNRDRGLDIFGRSNAGDNFTLLTVSAAKICCKDKALDYEKVVSDCIKRGFFIPDVKVRANRKSALNTVQKKISGIKYNCLQIPNKFIFGDNN